MTRKTGSFRQLANYILDKKKTNGAEQIIFKHNLHGNGVDDFVRDFQANEANRYSPRRKNSVVIYHEVLSWSNLDTTKLSEQVLNEMANKYLAERNPNAMFLGAVHADTKSRHIHFMMSGVETISGRVARIPKADMEKLKTELTAYEKQHLHLEHSFVDHTKHSTRKSDKEQWIEKQTGKPTRKDEIRSILEKSFEAASDKESFYENVRANGLTTYERGGGVKGVDDGRHFRFSTLGYDDQKFEELREHEERISEMEQLRNGQQRERDRFEGLELENNEQELDDGLEQEYEVHER